ISPPPIPPLFPYTTLFRSEARLYACGFGPDVFSAYRTNFAGLPRALAAAGLASADLVLADLGVSSMQLDDPARGFSMKFAGPLEIGRAHVCTPVTDQSRMP